MKTKKMKTSEDYGYATIDSIKERANRPERRILTVSKSDFMHVDKRNWMRLFTTNCPFCGKRISGRPCEWPYYIRKDDEYLWLCECCSHIRHVHVTGDGDDAGEVIAKFDMLPDGNHKYKDLTQQASSQE